MNVHDKLVSEDILVVHENNQPIYDIVLEPTFNKLYTHLMKLNTKNKKICIVCDSNTNRYYLHEVLEFVRDYAKSVESFTLMAGEGSKTLDTVRSLYEQLILSKFDRGDVLIALGGGVVGDLTGFTAATYLRGIDFIQIPTSLLAMVDSSIGGKTGVDFSGYKNMVGAFHQPKLVYINTSCLKTLPMREYCSGFGEVIKYGLINDPQFYHWLKENVDALLSYDTEALKLMIYRSCYNKRKVVEADPTEQGERALLNLGHTIGHAVEKLMNFSLLHGECVSIGIAAASYLSYQRGNITKEQHLDILSTLEAYQLPVKVSGLYCEDVLEATKSDKKMLADTIKFILLESMNHSVIDSTVTEDELRGAISFILQ